MNREKIFRGIISAASAASILLFSCNAFSQAPETSGTFQNFFKVLADQKTALEGESNDISLDQPLILGDRTLRSVIYELELVEAATFSLFNELNSSDDFDINCEREVGEDALVRMQICRPVFLDQFISESVSEERAVRRSQDLYDQLNEEMLELAQSDEELFTALTYRSTLQQELDDLFESELNDADLITAERMSLIPEATYKQRSMMSSDFFFSNRRPGPAFGPGLGGRQTTFGGGNGNSGGAAANAAAAPGGPPGGG